MDASEFLPDTVYDAAQVAALDARFIQAYGVDGFDLMQRAARAAYTVLARRWSTPGLLCVVCGPGNNGGDGFLLARCARADGWQVRLLCLVDPDRYTGDAARAVQAFVASGATIESLDQAVIEAADVVVDAVLGTGLNREVAGVFARAIDCINAGHARGAGVLSVDIASGVDAGTGRIWGRAVRADATVTFIGLKMGLLTGQGPAYCGRLSFAGLDAPAELTADQPYLARRLTERGLRDSLAPRLRASHKGDHGHVLCVGGNRGLGGAIRLCAEAALRAGAGLVSVACHPDHAGAMSQARPELMCRGVHAAEDLDALLAAASAVALGPGLGTDAWAEALWQRALASERTLIVDADALNRLARTPKARGNWIITPHPGEAARLLGVTNAEVVDDRVAAVTELARRYRAIAVLKGAGSLIATPDRLWLCSHGNPGMAVGGMGDLLTGVTAALAAQGLPIEDAASQGVYVHACAGDRAAARHGERGLLPSDLLGPIRALVNPDPS